MKNKNTNKTNYQTGAFLIALKNASMAKNKNVTFPLTNKLVSIADALKKMGFLSEVKKEKDSLVVALTYKNKRPVLVDVKLVSKPGLRVYRKADEIAEKRGPSTYLISTPNGVVSTKEAIKAHQGGEVIAEVW